jgi:hypothetical protein
MRRRTGVLLAATVISTIALGTPAVIAGASQIAQSAIVSANPADFTPNITDPPHANYHVTSIAQVGNEIFVAGEFTTVQDVASGGTTYTVSGLFAFDKDTGVVDTTFGFPAVNGRIDSIVAGPDGNSLYLGGEFPTIGTKHTKKLAKLNATTGAVITAFKATADNKVSDLAIGNGLLYLGGDFQNVDGQPRAGLAAVDLTTGALDPDLNLPVTGSRKSTTAMHVDKIDVSPDGTRLLVAGNFTAIGGVSRDQIAQIDLTTAPDTMANWSTNRFTAACASKFDTYIRDVAYSPDGSYFVVAGTGASAWYFGGSPTSGPLCDSSSRWETNATGSGLQPTWVDFTGGDTNYSVAITGTAIYLGGHQRWQNNYWGGDSLGAGGVRRMGIAAISPLNGVPFSWNPGRVRGLGAQALLGTADGLYVGSDTDTIGNEYHAKIALMPLAGGAAVPAANPGTLPGELYTIQQNGQMVARSFDGTTFGAPSVRTANDWSAARGAFMLSGNLYAGWSGGTFVRQTLIGNTVGTQKTVGLNGLETETKQTPGMTTQLAGATGMFWDASTGRLYYTVSGDAHLYYRYFNPQSNLLGDYRFTACTWSSAPASNTCGALNPGAVRGLTLAGGRLYFGQSNGSLSSLGFSSATGRPTGSAAVLSGPGIDGNDWNSRALFVRSDA